VRSGRALIGNDPPLREVGPGHFPRGAEAGPRPRSRKIGPGRTRVEVLKAGLPTAVQHSCCPALWVCFQMKALTAG
jgi:hypothetical protein